MSEMTGFLMPVVSSYLLSVETLTDIFKSNIGRDSSSHI